MKTSLLVPLSLLLAACAAKMNTPIADIAKLTSLEAVMDNQATASDPQFKRIGQASFTDAELAEIAAAAERIQATSAKTKDFAKGRAEFEALAAKVNDKAKGLAAAAAAKDAKAISANLEEMKGACRECHSKFR